MSIETAVQKILQLEPNILAIAVINTQGNVIFQTNNWDISPDIAGILQVWNTGGGGSLSVQEVNYLALEVIPERIVATNVRGQGHIVAVRVRSGAVIAYISPQGDARSGLTALIEGTRGL
jgi:hypothetical protein